jgi:hypothetical protein
MSPVGYRPAGRSDYGRGAPTLRWILVHALRASDKRRPLLEPRVPWRRVRMALCSPSGEPDNDDRTGRDQPTHGAAGRLPSCRSDTGGHMAAVGIVTSAERAGLQAEHQRADSRWCWCGACGPPGPAQRSACSPAWSSWNGSTAPASGGGPASISSSDSSANPPAVDNLRVGATVPQGKRPRRPKHCHGRASQDGPVSG